MISFARTSSYKYWHPKAFTLIELLVVISIMGVLTALLLPALEQAKKAAHNAVFLSNLRQLSVGYTAHRYDHDGRVLYGYTPARINDKPVTITAGGYQLTGEVAYRYPWRLAPYVGNVWEILHSHGDMPEVPSSFNTLNEAEEAAYLLSLKPTFGINATYVGGFSGPMFNGFSGYQPNTGAHVVFREDEVKNTSGLIVFTETQYEGTSGFGAHQSGDGIYFATPPIARLQWWKPDASGNGFELTTGSATGLPKGRNGSTPTAFFDGHVEAMNVTDLFDMRLWYNWAKGTEDNFINS